MTSTKARPPSGPAELLGREAVCAELEATLAAAWLGRGACVVLTGEAGIGKTTLAAWAAARAVDLGFVVRWGRCDADGATPPLGPWAQMARAHERELARAPDATALDAWRRSAP